VIIFHGPLGALERRDCDPDECAEDHNSPSDTADQRIVGPGLLAFLLLLFGGRRRVLVKFEASPLPLEPGAARGTPWIRAGREHDLRSTCRTGGARFHGVGLDPVTRGRQTVVVERYH